ncbi:MAG: twin-arginine translocation signal domain-containing protein [Thermoplasmatota archaeon]
MDSTRLAAHAALQTLYTLHGVDNPMLPALRRQVEHRSGHLSRRGFLGVVGASGAGLAAGAIFDPVAKLWTPTGSTPLVELAPAGVFRVDAALHELARLFAQKIDVNAKRWGRRAAGFKPSGWHGRGRNLETREDLGGGWMMSHARTILFSEDLDATQWMTSPEGHSKIDYIARRAGGAEAAYFNEQHPLMMSAPETDPTVRVADWLAPETGCLARVLQYEQANGLGGTKTFTDFELAGIYRPGKRT